MKAPDITKGDWQTWLINDNTHLTNEGQVAIMSSHHSDSDAKRICLVDIGDESIKKKDRWQAKDVEREANAKLISAAPDMAKALIALRHIILSHHEEMNQNEQAGIDMCAAALLKAGYTL